MNNALKNIGFFVLVIIISLGFYWLIFMDRQAKEDTFEYAMDLLGNKLLAMVPESGKKESVQTLYDDFSSKAVNQEIEPERVEFLAASILNLSNAGQVLTPEQAEAMLNFALYLPLKVKHLSDDSLLSRDLIIPEPPVIPTHWKPVAPERWQKIGERIRLLHEFNEEMKTSTQELSRQQRESSHEWRFRIDKELKISINEKLKAPLHEKEFKHLAREMQRLERERMLEWQENFDCQRNEHMQALHEKLVELKEFEDHEMPIELHELDSLQSLEMLPVLESVEMLKYIEHDSLRRIIHSNLRQAGIKP